MIGVSRRPLVMDAVRLAVYDEVMIIAKNHHIPATKRVDTALYAHTHANAQVTIPSVINFVGGNRDSQIGHVV